ncbi:MAG: DUF2235 domain-containing protein [Desulfobacteraceae bacterium]|nr:DUF2235 domain-containing protein [Desulfobacteraceae bacterium]
MEMNESGAVASPPGAGEGGEADRTTKCTENTAPKKAPRNIILLSDGTGNSAAKTFKTNVWRLYKALDLTSGTQIALYDDGVGTSGFKPLQILGGAFGWGLSRNVRDLYAFLCRHYQPGDQIYTFGFSRGAFTARTLAGMILQCGVLDPDREVPDTNPATRRTVKHRIATDHGLRIGVRLAYRSYRRRYPGKTRWAPIVRLARWIRDRILGEGRSREPDAFRQEFARDEKTRIQCVGVWDTVDAVGMPIDELSVVIDKFFYPHRFPDQQLSDDVVKALHAVAIDDERHTFHPVLWDEQSVSRPDQIKQVWFSGMHSDVGGGYPDDDLAHVPLAWMIEEVQRKTGNATGLDFDKDAVREIHRRATSVGRMHDSRRGIAVYYRYKPRKLDSLCNDPDAGVCIGSPRIHVGVIERIAAATDGYAPAGLPGRFRLVNRDGGESEFAEEPDAHSQRVELLERAQSHILWGRMLYFVLLLLTVTLAAMPHYAAPIPGMKPEGAAQTALAWVFDRLGAFMPAFVTYWMDSWVQHPWGFIVLSLGLLTVLWHRRNITANTERLAEAAWWHCRECTAAPPDVSEIGPFERIAAQWRRTGHARTVYRFWVHRILPVVFLALLVYLAFFLAYRVLVHYPAVQGGICGKAGAAPATAPVVEYVDSGTGPGAGTKEINFSPQNACVDTGVILHAGQLYRVKIEVLEGWKDGIYDAGIAGLSNLTDWFAIPFRMGFPARRVLSLPWFTLMGEIGRDSGQVFPMNRASFSFQPKQTGRLYLYVNDAINALGLPVDIGTGERSRAWNAYYLNNSGRARVNISWER